MCYPNKEKAYREYTDSVKCHKSSSFCHCHTNTFMVSYQKEKRMVIFHKAIIPGGENYV